MTLIPTLEKQRQEDYYEFEASLVYTVSVPKQPGLCTVNGLRCLSPSMSQQ